MKKAQKKTPRPIRPVNPVIAARVPKPLYDRIAASAAANGRSLAEEVASLIRRGFEWGDAYKAGMLAAGFQPLHDGTDAPRWVKLPEGVQGTEFMSEKQATAFFPTMKMPAGTTTLTAASLTTAKPALGTPAIEERELIENWIRSLDQKETV
jgi:hypothetical protein